MYKCDECGKVSQPMEERFTVVVETREHTFPFRYHANVFRKDRETWNRNDSGGIGTQIVKEIHVCGKCHSERDVDVAVESYMSELGVKI